MSNEDAIEYGVQVEPDGSVHQLNPHLQTFITSDDGLSITCKRCGRTSHNLNDVSHRWCGWCHVFHDDIAPGHRAAFCSGKLEFWK